MTASDRISRIPLVWCIAVTLLLGSAYREVRWSYVDTATNLSAAADSRSWHEVVSDSLTKSVEYRPLLDLSTKAAYQGFGLNLGTYQGIVVLEFGLLLVGLVLLFRPSGWRRVVAALLALSVAVGLHTSRILFLFVPLNAYATSMLFVLAAALLALTPGPRGREWVLLPLTLLAILWLEIGVLIVPLVAVAWVMKAPGTTWRSVAAASAAFAIYLMARFGYGPATPGLVSPDTGFGFSHLSTAEIAARFGETPWVLWLYNVGATMMTVLASEPRAGTFRFIAALKVDDVPVWMWLHVLSSVATTAVVLGALPGLRARPPRDRLIAAMAGVLILGGSALGFLYTRDRIGLPVGLGYAMLAYVAVAALLECRTSTRAAIAAMTVVAGLSIGWSIRAGEMYTSLRDTAWDYHLEWSREDALAAAAQSSTVAQMRASALKHRPADAERDPLWSYVLFERRFAPEKE